RRWLFRNGSRAARRSRWLLRAGSGNASSPNPRPITNSSARSHLPPRKGSRYRTGMPEPKPSPAPGFRLALARWTALTAGPTHPAPAAAQLEPRSIPSRNVESYSYQSPTMGNRYDISVGAPAGFRPAPGKKYPALVVTDGNLTFSTAV